MMKIKNFFHNFYFHRLSCPSSHACVISYVWSWQPTTPPDYYYILPTFGPGKKAAWTTPAARKDIRANFWLCRNSTFCILQDLRNVNKKRIKVKQTRLKGKIKNTGYIVSTYIQKPQFAATCLPSGSPSNPSSPERIKKLNDTKKETRRYYTN